MTRPAPRHQYAISGYLTRLSWILLGFILIVWLIDVTVIHSQWLVTKSAALGAILAAVAQAVFTGFVFRKSGFKARRQVVSQLYRGQMLKWLIIGAGFALIFLNVNPLSPFAVILGFMVIQLSQSLLFALTSSAHDQKTG